MVVVLGGVGEEDNRFCLKYANWLFCSERSRFLQTGVSQSRHPYQRLLFLIRIGAYVKHRAIGGF